MAQKQPGGWYYNILAFTELTQLHELGSDGDALLITQGQKDQTSTRLQTPVEMFLCPSRRGSQQYPFTKSKFLSYYNATLPSVVGRNDYAACSGNVYSATIDGGPSAADTMPDPISYRSYTDYSPAFDRTTSTGTIIKGGNGVVHALSEIRIAQISDGTSSTLFAGEKNIPEGEYDTAGTIGNDQGWDLGMDLDVNRWTKSPPFPDNVPDKNGNIQSGTESTASEYVFGSPMQRFANSSIAMARCILFPSMSIKLFFRVSVLVMEERMSIRDPFENRRHLI